MPLTLSTPSQSLAPTSHDLTASMQPKANGVALPELPTATIGIDISMIVREAPGSVSLYQLNSRRLLHFACRLIRWKTTWGISSLLTDFPSLILAQSKSLHCIVLHDFWRAIICEWLIYGRAGHRIVAVLLYACVAVLTVYCLLQRSSIFYVLMSCIGFFSLPVDIQIHIIGEYLLPYDLSRIALVCSEFHNLCKALATVPMTRPLVVKKARHYYTPSLGRVIYIFFPFLPIPFELAKLLYFSRHACTVEIVADARDISRDFSDATFRSTWAHFIRQRAQIDQEVSLVRSSVTDPHYHLGPCQAAFLIRFCERHDCAHACAPPDFLERENTHHPRAVARPQPRHIAVCF